MYKHKFSSFACIVGNARLGALYTNLKLPSSAFYVSLMGTRIDRLDNVYISCASIGIACVLALFDDPIPFIISSY